MVRGGSASSYSETTRCRLSRHASSRASIPRLRSRRCAPRFYRRAGRLPPLSLGPPRAVSLPNSLMSLNSLGTTGSADLRSPRDRAPPTHLPAPIRRRRHPLLPRRRQHPQQHRARRHRHRHRHHLLHLQQQQQQQQLPPLAESASRRPQRQPRHPPKQFPSPIAVLPAPEGLGQTSMPSLARRLYLRLPPPPHPRRRRLRRWRPLLQVRPFRLVPRACRLHRTLAVALLPHPPLL
jgi:hypothetical protein